MGHVVWIPDQIAADPFAYIGRPGGIQAPGTLGVVLPSERSASAVVAGEAGSMGTLLLHYLGRSAIIGAGLAIAGARGEELVKMSMAAAAAIEVALLAEAIFKKNPLPTGANATDVIRGVPGAIPKAVMYSLMRSILIGAGLAVVGVRGEDLVKYSLAGSAAVEAFVLFYAWLEENKKESQP